MDNKLLQFPIELTKMKNLVEMYKILYIHTHIHIYIYIYILDSLKKYIYIFNI